MGLCIRMRWLPSLSSMCILLPEDVVMAFMVWFSELTGLGVSGLGTAPAITGRSGSPSTKVRMTSVPFRKGKCMPWPEPPYGCIMRSQVEALPSRRPEESKGRMTLYRPASSSSAYSPLPAASILAFMAPRNFGLGVGRSGLNCRSASMASNSLP